MFSIRPTFWLFLSTAWTLTAGKACAPRQYGASSVVCVCNSTYCDSREPVEERLFTAGSCLHYASSRDGLRLSRSLHSFNNTGGGGGEVITLHVDRSVLYQEVIGYGGALTDSAAINIHSLSQAAGELLLRSYFGEDGSRYTLVRVPMGASDFSTQYYSYDDVVGDTQLRHFALRQFEDYQLKIPYLKRIRDMTGGQLKTFTCPWSAPYWMKDNGTAYGRSALRLENYQPWAEYFARYLEEYARANVSFWGVTPQNEPNQGGVHKVHIISMGWTAKQQRRWVGQHLGPTLRRHGLSHLRLMVYDDSGLYLPTYLQSILKSNVTRSFVSGVAIHAYHDDIINQEIISNLTKQYPDLFFLYTEGAHLRQIQLQTLGSWEIGEYYGKSLFLSANHGVGGWTDWNLALDLHGGPIWSKSPYNAPIIVNSTADEFYKQPSYYFLAHFSAFVPPGSRRLSLGGGSSQLQSVAFLTPDNTTVVNLMNTSNKTLHTVVSDEEKGHISLNLQPRSIHTLLYK